MQHGANSATPPAKNAAMMLPVVRSSFPVGQPVTSEGSPAAPRLWDIAYTAYRYVPLTPPLGADVADGPGADRSPFDLAAMRGRLAVFLDAYADDDPALRYSQDEVVAMVTPRLIAMAQWCAAQLDRPAIVQNGVMYRAHAEWLATGGLGAGGGVGPTQPQSGAL